MTDSLQIILDDVVAGTVERRPQGRLRFNYDAEYQEYPGHTPISLSMPIIAPGSNNHTLALGITS